MNISIILRKNRKIDAFSNGWFIQMIIMRLMTHLEKNNLKQESLI
jgi:hypothetical protein